VTNYVKIFYYTTENVKGELTQTLLEPINKLSTGWHEKSQYFVGLLLTIHGIKGASCVCREGMAAAAVVSGI